MKRKDGTLIMMLGKSMKKALSIGLCMVMLFALCACDTSDVWVFSLNGEKLYQKEVAAFAYVYVMEHNIQDKEQLEEDYENSQTYEEYYKNELEDDIISTTLLYKEATKNKIKLSSEQKKLIKTSAQTVVERFGQEILDKYEISESDVAKVYEMRVLGENYLESLSSGEMKTDDDSKAETDKDNKGNATGDSADADARYIKVYQVLFPTVELDENGMVRTDADGNLKKVSPEEIADRKDEALAFVQNVEQGADMEELVKDCSEGVSATNKYLKYEDLDKNYKTAIDKLSVGGVSDVIESDYGYCVVRLLEKNDKEYAKTMENYQQESDVLAMQEDELERLYSEYAQENRGYKNSSLWDTIDIKDYMK